MQVAEEVVLGEEAGLAVVPALHDVQGDAVEVNAGATGHAVMLAENRAWPLSL